MQDLEGKFNYKVSVIIPYKTLNYDVDQCLTNCSCLMGDVEIIGVPDSVCPGLPSEKRNWAMQVATGEIFAFIDSDAYPPLEWINKAINHLLSNDEYVAVCGPGVIPEDSSLAEKASDWALRWLPYSYRIVPKKARVVTEFPTFNLVVWSKYAKMVKFRPYLTGEDSLFCHGLNAYGDIYYTPDLLIYHRRRKMFKPYFKQVATYGYHRGLLIGMAIIGWFGTIMVYPMNFIKGFFHAIKKRGIK